jgi:prepilin peptidase dependent protein B
LIAIPSFRSLIEYYRITTATDNLYAAIQYARTESIKRNTTVYMSFTTGDTWCYGINTGSTCNCATAGSCNLGSTSASAAQLLTLSASGLSSNSFYFDTMHGGASHADVYALWQHAISHHQHQPPWQYLHMFNGYKRVHCMLILKNREKSAGFTFPEMLAALVINTIIFGGLITVFLSNVNHYRITINMNRLNSQLQTAMLLMTNEIRRAGYWANAQNDIGSTTNNNPFMTSGTDISINGGGNCILLTYDSNNNGSLPSITASADDERYGFRLNGNVIQARSYGAAFDCNAGASEWDNITDSSVIEITALSFVMTTRTILTGPGGKGIIQRSVDITLTGRLTSNPTITKTIIKHVRIMNDKFTDE